MIRYLAYTLLCIMFLTSAYLVFRFGPLPGKIAKKRGLPQATIIGVLGWGGVFTIGLLWILAMSLAFLPFDKTSKDELKALLNITHPLKIVLNSVVVVLFVVSFTIVMSFLLPPQKTIDAKLIPEARYEDAQIVGTLQNPLLLETSGIARSHREDDRIWLNNDSKNEELIFAVGLDGEDQGAFKIDGVTLRDWEDIASYVQDGTPYLLIADVGDNLSEKPIYELHAVVEPKVVSGQTSHPLVEVAWTLPFQYEDGPRDCESMAVDIARGEILLISKRDVPHRVYSLPLPKDRSEISKEPAVAHFVTEIPTMPQPTLIETIPSYPKGINKGMTTSFDISDDGQHALVLTYDYVYLYKRDVDEDWSDAFKRIPERKRVPTRCEAVGFHAELETFFIIPEHVGSPIYRFDPLKTTSE